MNVEFKNGQLVLTWPGDDDSTVTLDTAEAVVVADWMEDRDNRAAIRRELPTEDETPHPPPLADVTHHHHHHHH